MRIGRVTRASDFNFTKMIGVPDEVVAFFRRLRYEYDSDEFIVYADADLITREKDTKVSIEFMIYDDYVE